MDQPPSLAPLRHAQGEEDSSSPLAGEGCFSCERSELEKQGEAATPTPTLPLREGRNCASSFGEGFDGRDPAVINFLRRVVNTSKTSADTAVGVPSPHRNRVFPISVGRGTG